MTWKTSTPLYNRPQIFEVGSVHWPSKCEAWILPSSTNSAVTQDRHLHTRYSMAGPLAIVHPCKTKGQHRCLLK